MHFLEQEYPNEFLTKWMYDELTAKERHMFITSSLYKNLVLSKTANHVTIKEDL